MEKDGRGSSTSTAMSIKKQTKHIDRRVHHSPQNSKFISIHYEQKTHDTDLDILADIFKIIALCLKSLVENTSISLIAIL